MEVDFKVLGSSSSGNAGLLRCGSTNILIDAGFSGRSINKMIQPYGLSNKDIQAVFITHEHTDHITGIKGLIRSNPNIKIFANFKTAQAVQNKLKASINWKIFETGNDFQFEDIHVQPLPVPHDAQDPVGYVFKKSQFNLGWFTDLGHIPDSIANELRDLDILVLEANHDLDLLRKDVKRPWSVKSRILSQNGHLSNDTVFSFLENSSSLNWKQLYLAHLSKDCNDVSIVQDLFAPIAQKRKFKLQVIDPNEKVIAPNDKVQSEQKNSS